MNRSTRFGDCTDGLSNTFLAGERAYKQYIAPNGNTIACRAANAYVMRWHTVMDTCSRHDVSGNTGAVGLSEGHSNSIQNGGTPTSPTPPPNANNSFCGRGASSFHAGGAQFALAGGSVHFTSASIDWKPDNQINSTFEALGAMADGTVIARMENNRLKKCRKSTVHREPSRQTKSWFQQVELRPLEQMISV